jgi:hypothetical protein
MLEQAAEALTSLVAACDPGALRRRPEAEKPSPIEIIGHAVDGELAHACRLGAILFDDDPAWPGWDQERWVEGQQDRQAEAAELVERFRLLREINLPLWRGLKPADYARTGRHLRRGRETLGDLLRLAASRDLPHLRPTRRSLSA